MKAITIWQPYATLIAIGVKRYETRTWDTNYRGPLAIHAAKRPIRPNPPESDSVISMHVGNHWIVERTADGTDLLGRIDTLVRWPLVYGAVVAIAEIEATGLAENVSRPYRRFGDFTSGRYAWKLTNVEPIEPVPAVGRQRLWNWSEE